MRVSRELRHTLPFSAILLVTIAAVTIFVPPESWWVILIYILLISALVYGFSRIRVSRKYAIWAAVFAFFLLLLKASQLFDTINIILLVSLFVGIYALIK